MSGTFGSASNQFQLVDPRAVRNLRGRFRRDEVALLKRCNSFWCPVGRFPSKGWVLMRRGDYNQLNAYSTDLRLNIPGISTLKNLSIVQAQCVTRGNAADVNAVYIVEITDDRGILQNEWFQFPTTSSYNVRAPAYLQGYYAPSLNAGAPWTWNTMVQDLWNQMSSLGGGGVVLGNYPGLPVTPAAQPEGFWFPGVSAWKALNDIMEYLGLTIACDLTQDNPFTIVNSGSADAAFTALQNKYLTSNLEDDLEWQDVGAARVPKNVTVYFHRRNQHYGTEETVRQDALQWAMTPYYQMTFSAPTQFANALGTHSIWADFTVQFDVNGNPLAADTATAALVGAERVLQYFNRIYRQISGFMTQVYGGALPFVTGAQVDGVAWTQDFQNQARQGWKTTIVRGAYPPWPDIWEAWL